MFENFTLCELILYNLSFHNDCYLKINYYEYKIRNQFEIQTKVTHKLFNGEEVSGSPLCSFFIVSMQP